MIDQEELPDWQHEAQLFPGLADATCRRRLAGLDGPAGQKPALAVRRLHDEEPAAVIRHQARDGPLARQALGVLGPLLRRPGGRHSRQALWEPIGNTVAPALPWPAPSTTINPPPVRAFPGCGRKSPGAGRG